MFLCRMWFKKRLNRKKIHTDFLKSIRNQRYYDRHRAEILKKRKERYELTGE